MRTYEIVVQHHNGQPWTELQSEYSSLHAAIDNAALLVKVGDYRAVGVRPIGDYKTPLLWLDVNDLADVKGGVPCVDS